MGGHGCIPLPSINAGVDRGILTSALAAYCVGLEGQEKGGRVAEQSRAGGGGAREGQSESGTPPFHGLFCFAHSVVATATLPTPSADAVPHAHICGEARLRVSGETAALQHLDRLGARSAFECRGGFEMQQPGEAESIIHTIQPHGVYVWDLGHVHLLPLTLPPVTQPDLPHFSGTCICAGHPAVGH